MDTSSFFLQGGEQSRDVGVGDAIWVVNAKNKTQERIGWVDSAFIKKKKKERNLDDLKHTGNILEEKKWKFDIGPSKASRLAKAGQSKQLPGMMSTLPPCYWRPA